MSGDREIDHNGQSAIHHGHVSKSDVRGCVQGLTFKTVFEMYLSDMGTFGDEILPYAETSVRRSWEAVMKAMNVSIRDKAVVGKCSTCIDLRTRLLTVRITWNLNLTYLFEVAWLSGWPCRACRS